MGHTITSCLPSCLPFGLSVAASAAGPVHAPVPPPFESEPPRIPSVKPDHQGLHFDGASRLPGFTKIECAFHLGGVRIAEQITDIGAFEYRIYAAGV